MSGYAGGTAAGDLARLRRMVAEPGTATYTDSLLVTTISNYPLVDVTGRWPLLTSGSANTAWVATYDLAAAAADIWQEKATNYVGMFDFTADGASFQKSQVPDQYAKQARLWSSRRAMGSHDLIMYPRLTLRPFFLGEVDNIDRPWIGNLAEQDYP